MTHILPAHKNATRYRTTLTIDPAALDKVLTDRTFRRTKLGEPLQKVLITAGYQVPSWHDALAAASITASEAAGGKIHITAMCPRPWLVPAAELNPEDTISVEYIGGEEDGAVDPALHMDPVVPPNLGISLNGVVYFRTAYDLAKGVWLYQMTRNTPVELTEVDDEAVWDDEQA